MTTKQQINSLSQMIELKANLYKNSLENRDGKVSEYLVNLLNDVKNLNVYASQIADTVLRSMNYTEKIAKMSSKQAYCIAAAAVEGCLDNYNVEEPKKVKKTLIDSTWKSNLEGEIVSFKIFRKRFDNIEEARAAFMVTVNKSKRYTDDYKKAVAEMISKIA